jgi:uncharacterized protein YidB (DUF937 family)
MGLLDDISNKLKMAMGGAQAGGVLELVSGLLAKTDLGSLQGIVAKLEESGYGTQVKSWLGDGTNLPISADQLRSALGNEHVQQIARNFGLPVDDAIKLMAEHLPTAVDQASPNGTLPAET